MDQLKEIGLCLEVAIAGQPATKQPVVTKKRVVECLQQIGQQDLADILIKSQGKSFIKNKPSIDKIYCFSHSCIHKIVSWIHRDPVEDSVVLLY